MSIGDNIRKYRKAIGMKQWQLAEKIYISVSAMTRYERDETKLPIGLLKPIAKALNVSVEALLEDEEDEN